MGETQDESMQNEREEGQDKTGALLSMLVCCDGALVASLRFPNLLDTVRDDLLDVVVLAVRRELEAEDTADVVCRPQDTVEVCLGAARGEIRR